MGNIYRNAGTDKTQAASRALRRAPGTASFPAVASGGFRLGDAPGSSARRAGGTEQDLAAEGESGEADNAQVGVELLPMQVDTGESDFDFGDQPVRKVPKSGHQGHRNHDAGPVGQGDVQGTIAGIVPGAFRVRLCL
jgi:hypothetical protein